MILLFMFVTIICIIVGVIQFNEVNQKLNRIEDMIENILLQKEVEGRVNSPEFREAVKNFGALK